jgi:hypothetical protein
MSHTGTERGAIRIRHRRQREAVALVRAWKAWLKAGGDPRSRPPQPSGRDFSIARRAGL